MGVKEESWKGTSLTQVKLSKRTSGLYDLI